MSYHGSLHGEAGPSPYNGLSPMEDVSGLSPTLSGSSIPQVSSTENPQGPVATSSSDSLRQLLVAKFERQPPDNMRKSNFFNFVISIFDGSHQPVEIQRAVFKDFCDTHSGGQEYRNGLIYRLNVVYSDGTRKEEELYVRLIDSCSKQLVLYEGTCKNPDFRRVLLTHELICSRCLEHRSCGNKNDTPSDPIIIDRFHLKFFVKCNQNCLKNAGNPKDSRRRFQVALYSSEKVNAPIACSESMFVHNNSKHGRRQPSFREAVVGDGKPYIITVYPSEGWTTGGTKVCIVGMNFYEGIEVVFGTLPASCEVLSPNAIAVRAPQSPRPGEVDITLIIKGSQFCINNPGKFLYIASDDASFEHDFVRLERMLRNHDDPNDIPKEILLRRAADVLEAFYTLPKSQQTPTGPLNHISPGLYYCGPRSPALFPAIFTPQGAFTPGRVNPAALVSPTKMHQAGGGKVATLIDEDESSTGGVSRCSSRETIGHQQQHSMDPGVDPSSNPSIFQFPNLPGDSGSSGMPDIKPQIDSQTGVPKPKPFAPAGHSMYPAAAVAMPGYIQVGPQGSYQHPMHMPMHMMHNPMISHFDPSHGHGAVFLGNQGSEGSNRNNNNSTHEGTNQMPNMPINSIHLIPPSPGFFNMPPNASPGLPSTPTCSGGSSMFNFSNPPMISPSKPFKPAPFGLPHSEAAAAAAAAMQGSGIGMINYPPMFAAAMPSPQFPGTFLFPPSTPTGQLIAPISLPDLSSSADNPTTTTMANSQHDSSDSPPASKKRREDKSSPATQP